MKRTVSLFVTLACAGALALSGCSGSGKTSGATENADGTKTITWGMWGGSEDDQNWLKSQIATVEKQNKDIKIKLDSASWGDFWTKFTTNLSAGQVPCVVGINSSKVDTYSEAYSPLTDEDLKTAGIDPAAYGEGVLDMFKVGSDRLGIPYDISVMLTYLNKDAIKAAGQEVPSPDWSFADFERVAKAVTDKGDIKGFAVSPAEFQFLALPISYSGTQPIDKDGKIALTDPKFTEAAKWYASLVTEKKVADPIDSASSMGWGEDQFSNGNAAMAVDGTWNAVSYLKGKDDPNAPKFEVGVLPIPLKDGKSTAMLLGSGYGISKTCPDRTAALKVLGSLLSAEAQTATAKQGRSYPSLTASQPAYFESLAEATSPEVSKEVQSVFEIAFKTPQGPNRNPNWAKVADALPAELAAVYNGQADIGEVFKSLQDRFGK